MIGSVRGTVTHVGQDFALVEVGGIGYRVVAGPALLAQLRVGSEASVYTHHLVREDQQALFGFATLEELTFFELLMTVSQVGPRLALAITAAHPVTRLQLAIVTDDVDVYTSVSGVGRKTAQRIILELKEKVHAAGIAAGGPQSTDSDVVAALESLGYSASEARRAAGAVAGAVGSSTSGSRPRCRSSRGTAMSSPPIGGATRGRRADPSLVSGLGGRRLLVAPAAGVASASRATCCARDTASCRSTRTRRSCTACRPMPDLRSVPADRDAPIEVVDLFRRPEP